MGIVLSGGQICAKGENVHRKQPPLQDGRRTARGGAGFFGMYGCCQPLGCEQGTPASPCCSACASATVKQFRGGKGAPRLHKLVRRRGGVGVRAGTDDGRTALERGRSIGLDRRAADRRCGHGGGSTRIARIVGRAAARLGCRRRLATGRECRKNRQHQEPAHGWLPPQMRTVSSGEAVGQPTLPHGLRCANETR